MNTIFIRPFKGARGCSCCWAAVAVGVAVGVAVDVAVDVAVGVDVAVAIGVAVTVAVAVAVESKLLASRKWLRRYSAKESGA